MLSPLACYSSFDVILVYKETHVLAWHRIMPRGGFTFALLGIRELWILDLAKIWNGSFLYECTEIGSISLQTR